MTMEIENRRDNADFEKIQNAIFTSRIAEFYPGPLNFAPAPLNLDPFVPSPPLDESTLSHTFEPEDYNYTPPTPLVRCEKRIREYDEQDIDN